MRENKKEVTLELDGKEMTFVITKMDAFSGASLMKFVTEKMLPAIGEVQEAFIAKDGETELTEEQQQDIVKERVKNVMPLISKFLESITDEELIKLEKSCLKTVKCKLPAGYQPVLMGDSFGIPELEYDVANVLLLCYYVIEFNTQGFFGGKHSGSLLSKLNIFQPGA